MNFQFLPEADYHGKKCRKSGSHHPDYCRNSHTCSRSYLQKLVGTCRDSTACHCFYELVPTIFTMPYYDTQK